VTGNARMTVNAGDRGGARRDRLYPLFTDSVFLVVAMGASVAVAGHRGADQAAVPAGTGCVLVPWSACCFNLNLAFEARTPGRS